MASQGVSHERSGRVGKWLEEALSLVYPGVCAICEQGRVSTWDGYVCEACERKPGNIRVIQPPWCARCGLPYEGQINVEFVCANCHDLDLQFDWARASVVATPFVLE